MVPEAPLEQTEAGLVPAGEGWFVVNAKESRWLEHDTFGSGVTFEGRPSDWYLRLTGEGSRLLRREIPNRKTIPIKP